MIKMTEQRAKTETTGDGQATSTRTDPYEPWEEITRNEPTLSSIDEPLTLSEVTSPGPALSAARPEDSDLTTNPGTGQEAMGQRIIITGRVIDEQGNPVPGVLIEIWQANAAGRYTHDLDSWNAPLDPNFLGKGCCLSDEQGTTAFSLSGPAPTPGRLRPTSGAQPTFISR
jgi:protocatechuate 3,4-dioxygenase beta subunit